VKRYRKLTKIIDETDVYVDVAKKTRVSRTFASTLSVTSTNKDDLESQTQDVIITDESTPLLHGKVNPNSAIHFRPITLPSSSNFSRQRKGSEKKKKTKEFFEASQLATDMFADNRVRHLTVVPELRLAAPQVDISKSI
jgi:hypothetical protein